MGPSAKPVRKVRGQSAVEFAVAAPVLVLLLVVIAEFGRVFFIALAVHSAARAGAQYGSQSLASASDSTGMSDAAKTDWNNTHLNLTITPTTCTCISGSSVAACAASYCTANANATFVEVDTQVGYAAMATYLGISTGALNLLGISTSGSLNGKAIMEVQQ